MKASVGDRIMIASSKLNGPVRQGRVVELRHPDGSPPYLVEWSDDAQPALFFPGPDAHLVAEHDAASPEPRDATVTRHVRTWNVRVDVFEAGAGTTAHAVLRSDAPANLEGTGSAQRRPGDTDVPEIGDEIAVARALRQLADALLGTAAADLSAVEGQAVTLPG